MDLEKLVALPRASEHYTFPLGWALSGAQIRHLRVDHFVLRFDGEHKRIKVRALSW